MLNNLSICVKDAIQGSNNIFFFINLIYSYSTLNATNMQYYIA